MEPSEESSTSWRQPVPAEPLPWLDESVFPTPSEFDFERQVEYVGRVRLPIAGPYRPWARLYRLPDCRLVWVVRLWDRDRAVRRVATTTCLLEFARVNRFPALAIRIRSLDRRGRSGT
jgi:hypothetical protein